MCKEKTLAVHQGVAPICDNYYEIFVYSFCDSDGDGVGDLKGVIQKLPYVKEMGYTGIWLMPICQSPSYHKYDTIDYMSVDKQYGTMEDFEQLISVAHSFGIKVIIDLVVNHTSDKHPWFKSAVKDAKAGKTDGKYYNYYNFVKDNDAGYSTVGNSNIFYEAQFFGGMPDLNLDNPEVRKELEAVIKFWIDKGVDGYRLDACTSFYTGNVDKSADFVKWIKDTCEKYRKNSYIVGESWTTKRDIARYYKSGGDSFFYFPIAKNDGYIYQTLYSDKPADYLFDAMKELVDIAQGYTPAPFLDNHDTPRIATLLEQDIDRIKFCYGLLSTLNGNVFTYYGDEIGMISYYNDPDKRLGMLWDNDQPERIAPPGTSKKVYCFDGVKQQSADENSILNYYKHCNMMRLNNKEIARGKLERLPYDDDYVLIVRKSYCDSSVTIIINLAQNDKQVNIAGLGSVTDSIAVNGNVQQIDDSTVLMPRYSITLLK